MAWIQVDVGIREHDKIFNLADVLKITDAHAVGLMVCLWTWAVVAAPDGDITKFPPRAVAKAAGWDKKPELFFDAICSSDSMFIEQIDGRLSFRNWDVRAALLMDALERGREKTRKRVERYRNRKANENNVTDDINVDDVTNGNGECNVTSNGGNDLVTDDVTDVTHLPNQTIPNQTIKDTTTPTSSADGGGAVASSQTVDQVPYKKIMEVYNSTCTRLRKIKVVDGGRKKAVAARYKAYGMETLTAVFEKANVSEFLCGGGSKNWTADFDWLMTATNFAKVLEGKYNDQTNIPQATMPKPRQNRFINYSQRENDYNDIERMEREYLNELIANKGD